MQATPAFAQSEFKANLTRMIRKVGVHGSVGVTQPFDSDVTKGLSTGISVGLAPGRKTGWKYPFGLAWFSQELRGPTGDKFGRFLARPIMAGIGYGWHHGNLNTSVEVQGGISFNQVRLEAAPSRAFNSDSDVRIKLGNSPIVRPQVRLEYFLTPKVTLRTSLNYIYTQPHIVVQMPNGPAPGNWDAQAVNFSVGVGYYPFNKWTGAAR